MSSTVQASLARLRPQTEAMIANTLIKLQINARSNATVKATEYVLNMLQKKTSLLDPEEVKQFVAESKNKHGKPTQPETKNKWLFCHANFCKWNGIKWEKPYYKIPEKAQFQRLEM